MDRVFQSVYRGDTVGALTIALSDAPYGPGTDEAKVCQPSAIVRKIDRCISQNLTLQNVVSILNSTRSTEIPNIVKSLSQDAQDTLMKYLYKGMGMPGWGDVSGSVLLGWHEKVCRLHFGHLVSTSLTCFTVYVAHRGRGNWMHRTSYDGPKNCITEIPIAVLRTILAHLSDLVCERPISNDPEVPLNNGIICVISIQKTLEDGKTAV